MQNGKKRKDKVIIVRLDAEQKDQAERIATENGATVSELIRSLLSKKKAVKMIWPKKKNASPLPAEKRFAEWQTKNFVLYPRQICDVKGMRKVLTVQIFFLFCVRDNTTKVRITVWFPQSFYCQVAFLATMKDNLFFAFSTDSVDTLAHLARPNQRIRFDYLRDLITGAAITPPPEFYELPDLARRKYCDGDRTAGDA